MCVFVLRGTFFLFSKIFFRHEGFTEVFSVLLPLGVFCSVASFAYYCLVLFFNTIFIHFDGSSCCIVINSDITL